MREQFRLPETRWLSLRLSECPGLAPNSESQPALLLSRGLCACETIGVQPVPHAQEKRSDLHSGDRAPYSGSRKIRGECR